MDTPIIPNAPPNLPLVAPLKSPARKRMPGIVDKIDDLKAHIDASSLHDGIKAFLKDELALIKTNAAELHLHDVEHGEGGFNLHITLKPFKLGAG